MRRSTSGPPRPRAEVLDDLVETAAISLTGQPGRRFTAAQLCAEARHIEGPGTAVEFDHDFAAAVERATYLEADGEGGYRLR
jgi:hypothetical protein